MAAADNNTINAAFENAVRDFKATLGDEELLEAISKTKSIEDVYDATDALQKEQAQKGRLRYLAKIQPYLEGLRSYASVIEVFVQSKQEILSLIWGPIKLLLHWTNNMKQSFDAIVDALADIGLLLPEFQAVRELFSHNEHIKDVLVLFFRDILDFYLIVMKFFRKTYWALIFESMWTKQREKISIVKAQIQRHTLLLRREVGLEHIQEAHNAQLQALKHYEKAEKSFQRQEYQSIKADICPRTYEDKLDSFNARVYPGTGRWLLRDTTFAKWLDMTDESTKILWLQGIPGAGKTFLSSTVVHKAKEIQQTRTIYVFLSYTIRISLSALSILHSLIFQLATGNDDLQVVLCQSGGKNIMSSVEAAANLLKTLLVCAGRTYIMIDGIDEIDELERCRLLKQLLELSQTCKDVKILFSNRAEADIADLLKDHVSIRVDNRNAGSIQTFVRQRTEKWFAECNFLPEAQAEIQGLLAPLASKAKGMFLYAEVVLSSIDSLDDMEQIREELRVLPESLDAAYSRILVRINRLSPLVKDKVRKLLGWVACAPLPLTLQEIEQALVVSREDVEGNAKVIATLNMRRICGPIVEEVDGYVQFVHFTVKEYFFSSSITGSLNFAEANLSLAVCCVTYLCQTHHDHELPDEEIDRNILSGAYRLHDLASIIWFELVERSVTFIKQDTTLSPKLIDALETLRSERTSGTYDGGVEVFTSSNLEPFESISSTVHDMLREVACFRRASLKSNFDEENECSWINLDPLTISATSVRIHQRLRSLSCRNNKHQDCQCEIIRRHYGQRPFRCGFLNCPFRRHGFESRSIQRSHMKHHDRSWKCSIQDCEYAKGGFLSRKMRDDHHRDHKENGPEAIPHGDNLDADEIQPLLFDLVKADDVDGVRNLLDQFKTLPREIQQAIREYAASVGSIEMFDLLQPLNQNFFDTFRSSIRVANIEVFKHLVSRCSNFSQHGLSFSQHGLSFSYSEILAKILTSDSEEFFEEWEKYLDEECKKLTTSVSYASNYTNPRVIRATAGLPGRENLLISVWEKIGILKELNHRDLGSAVISVASTTCSVKLAKYFIDHGAKVDFRRNEFYLTPLHHAARQNSAAAAEMMKYLLEQGANPELNCARASLKIRDEKGAKGIARWLGMSWDELVEKTKEEREKAVGKGKDDIGEHQKL